MVHTPGGIDTPRNHPGNEEGLDTASNTIASKIGSVLEGNNSLADFLSSENSAIVPENLKESVLSKMSKNYPAYEMFSSLDIADTFTSYIFTGVKEINDSLGQAFVDELLDDFKSSFMNYLEDQGIQAHAVWDDYKNFVTIPEIEGISQDQIDLLMKNALEKKLKDEGIQKKLKDEGIEKKIKPLGVVGKAGIIEGEGDDLQSDIISSLAIVRMSLEKEYSGTGAGYLDFYNENSPENQIAELKNIGDETFRIEGSIEDGTAAEEYSVVNGVFTINSDYLFQCPIFDQSGKITKKLYAAFLNGEIPKSLNLHKIISETVFCKDINELANESAIRVVDGKKFTVIASGETEGLPGILEIEDKNGFIQRVQIFNPDDGFFNTSIITMVRKKKIPTSMAIYKKIRKILDMLVADGEFIFPYWKGKGDITLKDYIDIKDKLRKDEEIDSKLLNKACNGYYKGGLSKEGFAENIKDKTGQLYFIDIKDMGSINMRDFYNTLEQVRSGEITKEQAIVKSGGVMTEKFIAIIENLENQFGIDDIKYSIGGDEIKLFIEGDSRKKDSSRINKIITEQGIFGRITTSRYLGASSDDSTEGLLDKLDTQTEYSKGLEELFAIIERRLQADEREIGAELGKIKNVKNMWNTNIFSKAEISDVMKRTAFNMSSSVLNRMKSDLQSLYNFYIELDGNGNHENDTIHFAGKTGSFIISEVFDLKTKMLVPNSPFIDLLRKKGLAREDRGE